MSVPLDVFVLGGQSNAVGQGSGGPSLPAGVAWQWYGGSLTALTGDPVGNANTGSAWPAFARTWYRLTGRAVCFVPVAVSGSALVPAADVGFGHWGSAGTLFGAMTSAVAAALAGIATAGGYDVTLRGMVWAQGEADAVAIAAALMTATDYESALEDLLARFETAFPLTQIFVVQTGTRAGASDVAFAAVRAAQEAVATTAENGALVHLTAREFADAGWLVAGSDVHWSQAGLNHVGDYAARAIASGACFARHWSRMAGVDVGGAALPWKSITIEDPVNDRRMVISANIVNVTKATDHGSAQNLGLATNGAAIVVGAGTKVYFGSGLAFVAAGNGTPQGVVAAPVGSLFLRRDGGAGTAHYVKESGSGSTGWDAK